MPGYEATTELLLELERGNRGVIDRLFPLVYDELRNLAGRFMSQEASHHTLQPTALVHEAFLKLADQQRVGWQGRTHFIAVGAQVMRRLLVDHARRRGRVKRGGEQCRIPLQGDSLIDVGRDEDVLALDDVLQKLALIDPLQAQIVELRFFGGMTVDEVAVALNLSKRTVEAEWTLIRAWLRREFHEGEP